MTLTERDTAVAKANVPDDVKLKEGLLNALSGEAVQATGTSAAPGIFGSAMASQKLFDYARELGYFEPCDGPTPKGKAKPPRYGRITDVGRQWLLEQTSPRDVLNGLLKAFSASQESLNQEDGFHALQTRLAELQREIQEQAGKRREELARLHENLRLARSTVAGAIEELAKFVTPKQQSGVPDLAPAIETFVRQWQSQRRMGCPFPELYQHLQSQIPKLSIGVFHDLLRSLYDQRRIRLTGWHDSPDRMPNPNLALFVSSKVMYYADTPDGTS